MMPYLFALLGAACFASVNHIDKFLIEKYFKGGTIGALVLFSSFVGGVAALPILIFHPQALNIELSQALFLMVGGAFYIASLIPYFFALDVDEASIVSPLFLMVPVMTALLSYLFLDEVLTLRQMTGALIIVFGTLGLSLDLGEKIVLKTKVFLLMFISSLFMSLNYFFFKFIAVQTDFWTTAFWDYLGFFAFALFLFAFHKGYRKEFLGVFRQNSFKVLRFNVLNEIINVIGKLALNFGTLLAPIALVVWVSEGFQPFFVILIGIVLTLLFPKIATEKIGKKHMTQKLVSVAIMTFGLYLLSVTV